MLRKFQFLLMGVLPLCIPALASATSSAYEALRLVPGKVDPLIEKRVLEVSGKQGEPQPGKWVILLDDPQARGGFRELVVENGQVVSQRTPVRKEAQKMSIIPLETLQLDSSGAFASANAKAVEKGHAFYGANYRLFFDPISNRPVWVVELLNEKGRKSGEITVDAANGRAIRSQFETEISPQPVTTIKPAEGGFFEKTGRTLGKAGNTVADGFVKTGRSIKNLFTRD